jgi:hypothetical protein
VEFEGEFETHITVRADDPDGLDAVRVWADQHGLKFHHIILARGRHPSQPMVTRRAGGNLAQERLTADRLTADLSALGFPVVRVKIEVDIENRDVPKTDADGLPHITRYFEHHVKLVLEPDADLPSLTNLAVCHAAHVSRNARRVRDDGLEERFITQRCYRVGEETAAGRLDELLNDLNRGGYDIVSVEREYVVFDNAPSVDAGWLSPEDV